MSAFSQSNHPNRDDLNHQSDYYHYLDAAENASRYNPAIWFVQSQLNENPLNILDLGCGLASVCRYLPSSWSYVGVDHSTAAIEYCRAKYPQHRFEAHDLVTFLKNTEVGCFDAIVLCGILFHVINAETGTQFPDDLVLNLCKTALTPGGSLVVIAPFAFSPGVPGNTLLDQAQWKLDGVRDAVRIDGLQLLQQVMTVQIGIEKRIAEQRERPKWFVADDCAPPPDRYSGSRLASWTMIYERRIS